MSPGDRFILYRDRNDPPFTMGDFWSWALFDVQDSTNRGVLAEIIFAKSIGADPVTSSDTTIHQNENLADF